MLWFCHFSESTNKTFKIRSDKINKKFESWTYFSLFCSCSFLPKNIISSHCPPSLLRMVDESRKVFGNNLIALKYFWPSVSPSLNWVIYIIGVFAFQLTIFNPLNAIHVQIWLSAYCLPSYQKLPTLLQENVQNFWTLNFI